MQIILFSIQLNSYGIIIYHGNWKQTLFLTIFFNRGRMCGKYFLFIQKTNEKHLAANTKRQLSDSIKVLPHGTWCGQFSFNIVLRINCARCSKKKWKIYVYAAVISLYFSTHSLYIRKPSIEHLVEVLPSIAD